MAEEWYYTVAGEQTGPVSWDDLRSLAARRTLAPTDLVWREGMSEWAEGRTVAGLFPVKGPPPLPKTPAPVPPKPSKVTGEVVLEGFGGSVLPGLMNKVEVKLAGTLLGTGTLVAGFRLPFEAVVGTHTVELIVAGGAITKLFGGFGKKIEGAASGRTYPVEFPTAGHYLVTLTPAGTRGLPPSGAEVERVGDAPQQLALAPVAEPEPEEGLVQKGFAAIGRGLSHMRESSRRAQLHGLWQPVSGEGMWFVFTPDGAMLRADGLATRFRWADGDTVELFEDGCVTVVPLTVLSLGKSELIVKADAQAGHFYRTDTITQTEERRRREEAEHARAEFLAKAGTVAAVLALGGIAVLCGVAANAATLDSGGGELPPPDRDQRASGTDATPKVPVKVSAPAQVGRAVAEQGAVVIGSDGRTFRYAKKCDCGHVEPGETNSAIPTAGSAISTSFRCTRCGRTQDIRIRGS